MIPALNSRLCALLVPAFALMVTAGCTVPLGSAGSSAGGNAGSGRSRASAATAAACRQRANEVYNRQNRGDIFKADSYASEIRDSPFSTTGLPGITSAGLGGQYARDNMESDCLNSAAGNVGDSNATPVVNTVAVPAGQMPPNPPSTATPKRP